MNLFLSFDQLQLWFILVLCRYVWPSYRIIRCSVTRSEVGCVINVSDDINNFKLIPLKKLLFSSQNLLRWFLKVASKSCFCHTRPVSWREGEKVACLLKRTAYSKTLVQPWGKPCGVVNQAIQSLAVWSQPKNSSLGFLNWTCLDLSLLSSEIFSWTSQKIPAWDLFDQPSSAFIPGDPGTIPGSLGDLLSPHPSSTDLLK